MTGPCGRHGSRLPAARQRPLDFSVPFLVVSDLLSRHVPIEDLQYLASHANPETTQPL